jgi:hypothetical protein
VWRVRPALTTDRMARGADFDKLSIYIGGPLHGFTPAGQPVRTPSCRFGVPYRLNWFRQDDPQQAIVDPMSQTCISEHPLDQHPYRVLRAEVELYRKATIGVLPLVMVSKPRRLRGGDDHYEANYDPTSGVVLINNYYVTPGNHPALDVVVDRLLGSAILLSAATSPNLEVAGQVKAIATGLSRGARSEASIAIFADTDDNQRITNATEVFAEGLNIMRHRPTLFRQRFEALSRPSRALARNLKDDIVALIRLGLELNGHGEYLHQFVSPEIQRL